MNSARKAEKLGYTNVKVYHEGIPEWVRRNYLMLSAQSYMGSYVRADIPHVLLDVRPESKARRGFIPGAVTFPAADVDRLIATLPPADKRPPVIVYDQKGGEEARKVAQKLSDAGYRRTMVMSGGYDLWFRLNHPTNRGSLATQAVFVPKPRPGEIAIEEFKRIAAAIPADTIILDVRTRDEANAGMIRGALLIPDEEILDRLAEIPRDKKIIAHCAGGVRAEMAFHKLREKGYTVNFLNAQIVIDKDGNYTITRN